jgi:feruloyl esterase
MSRPLCPYPLVAEYEGKGDTASAENFRCAMPQAG